VTTEQQIALLNARLATGLLNETQYKFYVDVLRAVDPHRVNILDTETSENTCIYRCNTCTP
jgi:hypothetical protein